MNFEDTPEEAAFRAEARAWLEANARQKTDGAGPLVLTDAHSEAEAEFLRRSKEWQHRLYDGGWAAITWPREYGGRGGTPVQQIIFDEEQAHFDVPWGAFAHAMIFGPTLIAHATESQKRRYLVPMLRGDEVWCQLFSEPGAGSDLAGLQTRAVRDDDEYVINGQKVWNSGAHYSDFAILLARTDPDVPKHRGITYFILDMRTPGIEVKPLRQITGAAHFNQVFLTDVRVAAEDVVGQVNAGWDLTMTTLTNERVLVGSATGIAFSDLYGLACQFKRTGNSDVRHDLASAYIRFEILKYLRWRLRTALSQGRQPGPESSVLKLVYSRHLAALGDLSLRIQGPHGMLFGKDAPDEGCWQLHFLSQWASRIGGGTEEIQRNVIGERVLGLPKEPRDDKGAASRDLLRTGEPR